MFTVGRVPCDINVCAVCNLLIGDKKHKCVHNQLKKKNRVLLSYALLTPFLYNQGWGKTDNVHTADILQEAEVHILHFLMSSNFYDLARKCFNQ